MNVQPPISVIIADDESAIRNGLHTAIPWQEFNMTVSGVATDGMEAWELIQTLRPDIVITDIRMPRLDGLELLKKCRDSGLCVHIILLSGYDDFSYAQTAIRYGARAYVLKPLKVDELTAELESLREELEQAQAKKEVLSDQDYHSFQELSKKMFFNQLIHNEFHHNRDICRRISELGITLPCSDFQILVFHIRQTQADTPNPILSQAKERIIPSLHSCPNAQLWESDTTHLTLLLPLPDFRAASQAPAASEKGAALSVAENCLHSLMCLPGCLATVGIGPVKHAWIDAGHSYGMALTALSYQLYESGRVIYDQDVICSAPPSVSSNSIDTEPLIDAIRKNDKGAIKAFCESFYHSLLYVPMPPPSFIRGMSIYLVTDVQNTLRKLADEDINLFAELPYVEINQMATLRQIREWSVSLFVMYGGTYSQYLTSRKDQVILKAKEFIRKHMNQKIPAEEVASFVNLSPSYFTIYFKSKTGINFRDYIINVKMEHAKRLLKTARINISEVSYAVGYDDYRSFYRAFKNYTGLTPTEYQAKES